MALGRRGMAPPRRTNIEHKVMRVKSLSRHFAFLAVPEISDGGLRVCSREGEVLVGPDYDGVCPVCRFRGEPGETKTPHWGAVPGVVAAASRLLFKTSRARLR